MVFGHSTCALIHTAYNSGLEEYKVPGIGDEFEPGETVPKSGIYRVEHDSVHAQKHEVTCVYGKKFPPCNHCGHGVRFVLVRRAQHIERNEWFK
ncbi:MAG TPA: hypothetical protein VMI06_16740 [Terriglobia bacterium]|nr:hypothetical protein [Terriglobia bacterium]